MPRRPPGLTPRKRQIADLLGRGYQNKEIAAALGLSESTVKDHITDLYRLLGVDNRAEAALTVRAGDLAAERAIRGPFDWVLYG